MLINPKNAAGNWCIVSEFPSYADAKAFQELTADLGPLHSVCRPKQAYQSGEVKDWRLTKILRNALSGRSFHIDDAIIVAEEHGYKAVSMRSWLAHATRSGLTRRLEKGIYEFLPQDPLDAVPASNIAVLLFPDHQCAACQPESLRCEAR